MASAQPVPSVVMFALCESVDRDLTTGLLTMTGVAGGGPWNIDRLSFPSPFGRLFAYIVLTGVHGVFKFDLRLAPLSGASGGRQHCAVRAASPRDYCELVVPLSHWKMDHPGEYALELLVQEAQIATRRFTARQILVRPPGGGDGGKGEGGPKKG